MDIKTNIAKSIKWTYVFQKRAANKFFSDPGNHLDDLNIDEEPLNRRFELCRFDKYVQIANMLGHIDITIRPGNRFQTWIDTGLYVGRFYAMTDNVPPYYAVILEHSLQELVVQYGSRKGKYYNSQKSVLLAVENYIKRVIGQITIQIEKKKDDIYLPRTKLYFERMLTDRTRTLEEALQRILFWSSIFWQSQHRLVGLVRLDKILEKYDNDHENSVELICDFYEEIHRYYAFKSSSTSLGDTGQIIVLGGLEEKGKYSCNSLTYDFLNAMKKCKLPDPKILLRVSQEMPDALLRLAIECIGTGIGCPLLANDDVIVPALLEFGYEESDAYDYVTSACWEPLVYGNSLEKNNIKIMNLAIPFVDGVLEDAFLQAGNLNNILNIYKRHITVYLDYVIGILEKIKWEKDPLGSLLTIDCFTNGKDVSEGGAKYNDYGVLSIGLTNVIDSLFNIQRLVFDEKRYTLEELQRAVIQNYEGYEVLRRALKEEVSFGRDKAEVVSLVNEITTFIEDRLDSFKNKFGGRVKFGLSASNYVEVAQSTYATLDGRKANEPLHAHITCSNGIPYTELLNFASQIDYGGVKSNGNVVDFFVSPSFIEKNSDKFMHLIRQAIRDGFFELQMNVVSSATLIDAKRNPGSYPNLIVRVWGFSAYFKDLPEEYQNVLIERAIESESAV